MRNPGKILQSLLAALAAVITCATQATIVRMDLRVGQQGTEAVYIELLDNDAPNTVANFLNYIENANGDRRYDGTFIHRSIAGFVVQGGGFLYDPAAGPFQGTIPHIPVDAPVANEFNPANSNLRGTLAMAKLPGDPDSATSEWFINLTDNSADLDFQNGGFTVFARVLGPDMDVFDRIAALPTETQAQFSDLPTDRASSAATPNLSELVVLEDIQVVPTGTIRHWPRRLDFGVMLPGQASAPQRLNIQNVGGTDLTINAVVAPFQPVTSQNDGCSGTTLAPAASCQVDLVFTPTGPISSQGTVIIDANVVVDANTTQNISSQVSFTAVGATANATLAVPFGSPTNIDLGAQLAGGAPLQATVTLQNIGNSALNMLAATLAGDSGFGITDNCNGASLLLGETCTIDITLAPTADGDYAATLTANAEPGGQQQVFNLTGRQLPADPVLALQTGTVIDLGDVLFSDTTRLPLTLRNDGGQALLIAGGSLAGADAGLFSFDLAGCGQINPLTPACTAYLVLTPGTPAASLSASLTLSSNDPTNTSPVIELRASASQDRDGIPDAIEQNAPNNGDGNDDGIQDALQDHVASLPDINGDMASISGPAGSRLSQVRITSNPSPANAPTTPAGTIRFPNGFFSFDIEGLSPGASAQAIIDLPAGSASPDLYFKYDSSTNRWSTFSFDDASSTGARIQGRRIVLDFVDGGRGDADGTADGRIRDPGAPGLLPPSGGSSGGGGCSLLARAPRQVPAEWLMLLAGALWLKGRHRISRRRH